VVTVFNGRDSHSNTAAAADDEPLALVDAKVHALPAGYGFYLNTERPIIPAAARAASRG
jgi:hypothetical protein